MESYFEEGFVPLSPDAASQLSNDTDGSLLSLSANVVGDESPDDYSTYEPPECSSPQSPGEDTSNAATLRRKLEAQAVEIRRQAESIHELKRVNEHLRQHGMNVEAENVKLKGQYHSSQMSLGTTKARLIKTEARLKDIGETVRDYRERLKKAEPVADDIACRAQLGVQCVEGADGT